MPSIFLQEELLDAEIAQLREEFPHYDFLQKCSLEDWPHVEILYGNELDETTLKQATRLKWIHSPTTEIGELCIGEIKQCGDILITLTKGQNIPQMAEFAIGAMLAFAKQYFHWTQVVHDPQEFWQWPLRDTMWTLHGKTLLQVGLGEVGTAIVKRANAFGMKTWGVRHERSFHPDCRKTFPIEDLHSILPAADIVTLALPKGLSKVLFKEEEFKLMKPDSILIVIGSADFIEEADLAKVAKTGKFRGVLLDAFRHPPPPRNSPLWEIPNGILTPSVSSYPKSGEPVSFRIFRRNLRLFITGNLSEMKNIFN